MTLAAILLAAGRSERFGAEDKLLADYRGAPLVSYAADALRGMSPDILIAVTGSEFVAATLSGFMIVSPDGTGNGLSDSLRAGISAAQEQGVDRALVVLGDMPFVTTEVLQDIVARCSKTQASTAADRKRRMPPACFPKAHFSDLMSLSGDQGAKPLLSKIPGSNMVETAPDILRDVDTIADLNRLSANVRAEARHTALK